MSELIVKNNNKIIKNERVQKSNKELKDELLILNCPRRWYYSGDAVPVGSNLKVVKYWSSEFAANFQESWSIKFMKEIKVYGLP